MTLWVAVLVAGALSYALRVVPVLVASRRGVPAQLDAMMRNASTAVLAALLTVHLQQHRAAAGDASTVVAIAAVAVALAVAIRARSMLGAVIAGLAVFAAVSLAFGLPV